MEPIKFMEPKIISGPGKRLREAREGLKLSIDQVAYHLKLETKLISELEADRYENMPRFTFVRGYIRNYAKFVDVCPNELIEIFDNLQIKEKPSMPIHTSFSLIKENSFKAYWQKAWIRCLFFAFLGFLGLLVYLWVEKEGGLATSIFML